MRIAREEFPTNGKRTLNKFPTEYGGKPIREDMLGYKSQSIKEAEKSTVLGVLEGDYFTRGPTIEDFEDRITGLVGVNYAVVATAGTTALHLSGRAGSFDEGDKINTTS